MKPVDVFNGFLKSKGLKCTGQRAEILKAFLNTKKHVTADDLYDLVKRKDARIGHATVFRTLKLMRDAGIARAVGLGDKVVRFERELGHPHHDHLVCTKCGTCIEAADPEIEELQKRLAERFSFSPTDHKMEIFGVCKSCRKRNKSSG